jgi:hypothetical protein
MVTATAEFTATVWIVKLPLLCPPGITSCVEAKEATAELLLERVTTAPPRGAANERVTVPEEVLPPGSDAGEREMPATVPRGRHAACNKPSSPPRCEK